MDDRDSEVMFALGEIKGQISMLTTLIATIQRDAAEREKRNEERHTAIEERVRAVEHAKAWLLGAAATLGALAGYLADLVLK